MKPTAPVATATIHPAAVVGSEALGTGYRSQKPMLMLGMS